MQNLFNSGIVDAVVTAGYTVNVIITGYAFSRHGNKLLFA
jgi:ABC-type glycerol-3-phosphate transport system permease component